MTSDNNKKPGTSTQIRNFYSDGMAYLNTSFFNTNLSFKFHPFISKDNIGRSTYDMKNGLNTTVNFEGAYALYHAAKSIIDGKVNELDLPIPCAAGATLNLARRLAQDGMMMETIFSITKNNVTIEFRFSTFTYQTKENGQIVTKVIESGLGAFMKTVEGYLNGINSDRHLDKLTEDYVKSLGENNGNQQGNNNSGGYQQYRGNNNNGGYRKNYNNNNGNNGYRKQYYNNGTNQQYNNNQPSQQNLSTYQIHN